MKKYCFIRGKKLLGLMLAAALFVQSGSVAYATAPEEEKVAFDEVQGEAFESQVEAEEVQVEADEVQGEDFEENVEPAAEPLFDTAEPSYFDYGPSYFDDESSYDDEEKITVTGKIIGYTGPEPFEIVFTGGIYGDIVTATAVNGQYTAEFVKNEAYVVVIHGTKDCCLYTPDNENYMVSERDGYDIKITMLDKRTVEVLGNISGFAGDIDYDEKLELLENSVVAFENDGYYGEISVDSELSEYYWSSIPVGEYDLILKGKNGNIYYRSKVDYKIYVDGGGYIPDYLDIYETYYNHDIDVSKGDYKTKDSSTRVICSFENLEASELSNASFHFVDSKGNKSAEYSALELRAGLAWLSKDKSYKIVASGLPEGIGVDYSNMNDLVTSGKEAGYAVRFGSASTAEALEITKDTEDAVVNAGQKHTFKIEAKGTDLKYCWYYKYATDTKFHKAGAYTNEFTRHIKAKLDGMQVYCVVTDGEGNKVTGRTATVTLAPQAPVITYPLGKELSAAKREQVNFVIKASSNEKLTYCWYYIVPKTSGGDGKAHKAGCYKDTYTRTAGKKINGMQAYCVVTDASGRTTKSDMITFTLK